MHCPRVPFPCANNAVEGMIFQKDCMFETCLQCRAFLESDACVFQCPTLFNKSRQYKWKEFEEFFLENSNSIKELRMRNGGYEEFKERFLKKLSKYRKHYFKYR